MNNKNEKCKIIRAGRAQETQNAEQFSAEIGS